MSKPSRIVRATLVILAMPVFPAERLRNNQIITAEFTLKPGESLLVEGRRPAVTVYFDNGTLEFARPGGSGDKVSVRRGEVVFQADSAAEIRNAGSSVVKLVRTEFLTGGGSETWGAVGLAPNYRLLLENRYTRVYEIKIAAGAREPQHTHKARVVVCLSGAELRHLFPDGREEPSTLKTDEVAWRSGGTHIGQNIGRTDLWAIAIEPK